MRKVINFLLLKKEEMNDTYLTDVFRLSQSIKILEKLEKNRSFLPELWLSSTIGTD